MRRDARLIGGHPGVLNAVEPNEFPPRLGWPIDFCNNGYIAGDFHEDGKVAEFQEFVSKHAFTRYCWLTTDSLVKRDHGPPAGALRAFTLHVGLFATPWLHPKGG